MISRQNAERGCSVTMKPESLQINLLLQNLDKTLEATLTASLGVAPVKVPSEMLAHIARCSVLGRAVASVRHTKQFCARSGLLRCTPCPPPIFRS